MDARVSRQRHAPVRVLTGMKKLDDAFGQFLVRVVCDCGAYREIEPSPCTARASARSAGRVPPV